MNQFQIQTICNHFNLGKPVGSASRVYGGLIHLMWRITTDKQIYAVKQINVPLTDVIRQEFERTEQIAAKFIESGIPAITSIKAASVSLCTVGDTTFMVYPWLEAKVLSTAAVSEGQAVKMAGILSRIHQLNIRVEGINNAEHPFYSQTELGHLFESAISSQIGLPGILLENADRLLAINGKYIDALPALKRHAVISHGDLDQKNVLWDADESPYLIDWESARLVNPTLELLMVALDWSGVTADAFDKTIFLKIIQTYNANNPVDDDQLIPCLNGVMGNWINWLAHNIKKLISGISASEKEAAYKQVQQTCQTIIYIDAHFDEIISWL